MISSANPTISVPPRISRTRPVENSCHGEAMSVTAQFLDSVNVPPPGRIAEIWAPVGLRYHALHHMFPGVPYHHLGEAHRRLMQGLPPDSVYRGCNRDSFFSAVRELWRSASRTPPVSPPVLPGSILLKTTVRSTLPHR